MSKKSPLATQYPRFPETGLSNGPKAPRSLSFASRQLLQDLLTLLDFDLNVHSYTQQPLQIKYIVPQRRGKRIYTPELLIIYRTDIIPAKWMSPLLCEVRCREDLFQNWTELKPKIRAARAFARAHKWRFQILTEREIRTPYLENAKFLLTYRRSKTNWEHADLLMDTLSELRQADVEALLAACSSSKTHRLELLHSLWHLVSRKWVGIDLTAPLTMGHLLWPNV